MRLFVSALLLAAATAAFGQNQTGPQSDPGAAVVDPGGNPSPQQLEPLKAKTQEPLQEAIAEIERNSQSGCPVTLTSARLNWPASYLPVTSAEKVTQPSLALGFKNSSGKAIRSATITARFLGKQDVYQLDAGAFDLRLTFSGVDAVDKAAEQLREIRVPAKLYAYGVTRVSLEQVLFADGSLWTPFGHGSCSLDVQGSAERVAR